MMMMMINKQVPDPHREPTNLCTDDDHDKLIVINNDTNNNSNEIIYIVLIPYSSIKSLSPKK